MLDVLADLRKFAHINDMPLLAEQLDDTALLAMAEFAAKDERYAGRGHVGDKNQFGEHPVGAGAGKHA
jgi:hypothetical protein